MVIIRVIFYLIIITGFLYFFVSKRRFDFFSLAYLSSAVYFLPGFLGYLFYPYTDIPYYLANGTYLVMYLVIVSIIIGGFIFDKTFKFEKRKIILSGTHNTAIVLTIISVVSFILLIMTVGNSLFSPSKSAMMEEMNRWHIIMVQSASLGSVISFIQEKKKIFFINMFFLFFNLFIGYRSILAITIISLFIIYLSQQGKQKFVINNTKISILGFLSAAFFFLYKGIYVVLKAGYYNLALQRICDPHYYLSSITNSEPFITQLILNRIMITNYKVGINHLTDVIYQFILFAPKLGAEITSFNSMFQPDLFPEVNYGMAGNIWAEMWSSGGWVLLIIFIVLYNILLGLGSKWLFTTGDSLLGLVVVIFTYWAFFIHRNTLFYQVNLGKRVLVIWLIATFTTIIFLPIRKKILSK